jgi:hypothetical protein
VCAQWERMWDCPDNQEVGLEAAILERVRNSSLVKWSCADNVAGLKHTAEAVSFTQYIGVCLYGSHLVVWMGRGASCIQGSGEVTQPWRVWE